MKKITHPRIIVVLDYNFIEDARYLIDQLDPTLCRLKIGKSMFTRYGPPLIKECIDRGFSIFLDLKFHDIPEQVAGACRAAAELGVWMINVHISGGKTMLESAYHELQKLPAEVRPLLVGVTLLTSLDQNDLTLLGIRDNVETVVLRFATLAKQAGLDGVVCSAQEAKILREKLGNDFLLVTPGIRLVTGHNDDQKRVMTPHDAIQAGADYLVIGRPITQSADPRQALERIISDMRP